MMFGNDDVIGGDEGSSEVTALSGEAAGVRAAVDTQPNVDTQSVADSQFDTEELPIVTAQSNGYAQPSAGERQVTAVSPSFDSQPSVVAQSNGYVQPGTGEQQGIAAETSAEAQPNTDSRASDDEQPNAQSSGAAYAGVVRHGWGTGLWKRRKPLGRPRVSTLVLMSVWVAVFAVYLVVRPA
ncbi:hypothetical protein [Nocardia alni]|uniref:hypothetical protein n=1 Tax=Nocardia alni TaxID=2815723 RepID=UPI001C22822E|nr:hypothetical protein [Nocardia alni]